MWRYDYGFEIWGASTSLLPCSAHQYWEQLFDTKSVVAVDLGEPGLTSSGDDCMATLRRVVFETRNSENLKKIQLSIEGGWQALVLVGKVTRSDKWNYIRRNWSDRIEKSPSGRLINRGSMWDLVMWGWRESRSHWSSVSAQLLERNC